MCIGFLPMYVKPETLSLTEPEWCTNGFMVVLFFFAFPAPPSLKQNETFVKK